MIDQDPTAAPAAVPSNLAATYVPADRYGFLERAGARLRYACWNVPGTARGTVVVLTGRGEFIEKYATEVVGELLGRGYAVIAMDWRGQGLSDRPLADRNKGHIDNFATYMADLRLFLDKIVDARRPPADPGALPFHGGAHRPARAGGERIGSVRGRRAGVADDRAAARGHAAVRPHADAGGAGGRGALPVRHRPLPPAGPRVQFQLRDPRRAALPLHRGVVRRRPAARPGRAPRLAGRARRYGR